MLETASETIYPCVFEREGKRQGAAFYVALWNAKIWRSCMLRSALGAAVHMDQVRLVAQETGSFMVEGKLLESNGAGLWCSEWRSS